MNGVNKINGMFKTDLRHSKKKKKRFGKSITKFKIVNVVGEM